jgi:hypothetical protein
MPLRRAPALYENVRKSVPPACPARVTEFERTLEVVRTVTILKSTIFDLDSVPSARGGSGQPCGGRYGEGAFVKSAVAAVGVLACTVIVSLRSPS